jgi:putative nucleotidyltransferase with HDIG domain
MEGKLNKIIVLLCKCIGQRKVYFSEHPIIIEGCQNFLNGLQDFFTASETEKLSLGIADNKLVYEGHYLFGPSVMGSQLLEFARLLHCAGFVFSAGMSILEVQRFLDLVDSQAHPVNNLREAQDFLKLHAVNNIQLEASCVQPSAGKASEVESQQLQGGGSEDSEEFHSPFLVYQALYDIVAKSFFDVSLQNSLDLNGAQTISEHLMKSAGSDFTDILQFVQYPDHDSYTVGHSVRVATLAVFVANTLGVEKDLLIELGTAALLHDVGKGKIPSEIIYKQGKLTDEEFTLMRLHPQFGAEILLEHKESSPMQVAIAWSHHIRYGGGGYPRLPSWTTQSRFTSLVQICDVFEALTASRPYKPPMTPLAAFGIMVNDAGAFDPALLTAFISALGVYPPGSQVRMNNGCLATVVATGKRLDKPKIRITHDEKGLILAQESGLIVDLAEEAEKKAKDRLEVAELLTGERVG